MKRISESEKQLKQKLAGKSGVYIISSPGGDCYVGSSVELWKRYLAHKTYLRNGEHRSKALQATVIEHGFDVLKFEILLVCSKDHLLFYEQRALDVFRPKFNTSPTAGSCLGLTASEETRAKQSAAKKGKPGPPKSEATREKLSTRAQERYASTEFLERFSASMRGIPKSEEHKAKLSAANKGKPSNRKGAVLTPEQREKLSIAHKARWARLKAAATQ